MTAEDAEAWWSAWLERLEVGEDPTEFVQEFPDDALISLLQTAGSERPTERNLILAETLRRVSGRTSGTTAHATDVLDKTVHELAHDLSQTAQAVHETEAAVEAKANDKARGGASEEGPRQAHRTSAEVEKLRDLAHEVERKADHLMRLQRTGQFVTPGRAGEETRDEATDKGENDE